MFVEALADLEFRLNLVALVVVEGKEIITGGELGDLVLHGFDIAVHGGDSLIDVADGFDGLSDEFLDALTTHPSELAETAGDDVLEEIRLETGKKRRTLVTTLTKKLAEDLSKYLCEIGVKAKYLHSDIDTIERIHLIKDLRLGVFDVLVGINLLREGLDIPEVSLVAILDADKQGFLRSETALIQTCGRASRNASGRVIMYGDRITDAMSHTIETTKQRRKLQDEYNRQHGIVPKTIHKSHMEDLEQTFGLPEGRSVDKEKEAQREAIPDLEKKIKECEIEMRKAAKELRFEDAAHFRDLLRYYQSLELLG